MENNNIVQVTDSVTECIHHWMIDARNSGICKKCGVHKQFSSSWDTVQRSWNVKAGKTTQPDAPVTKK